MNLPFQLYIDKKQEVPTYFPQKILYGLLENKLINIEAHEQLIKELIPHLPMPYGWDEDDITAKMTTIRESLKWREGMNIHFIIYNHNPKRYQFAPVLQVKRVEPIEFLFNEVTYKRAIILGDKFIYHQTYDDLEHYDDRFTQLWQHEGFESEKAFWDWFKKPLKGGLIHWISQ